MHQPCVYRPTYILLRLYWNTSCWRTQDSFFFYFREGHAKLKLEICNAPDFINLADNVLDFFDFSENDRFFQFYWHDFDSVLYILIQSCSRIFILSHTPYTYIQPINLSTYLLREWERESFVIAQCTFLFISIHFYFQTYTCPQIVLHATFCVCSWLTQWQRLLSIYAQEQTIVI